MRKVILIFVGLVIGLSSNCLFSQNEEEMVALGLPGDNLNLYAVLDVFEKSKTLEEFERAINDPKSNINNLDLNNDNLVDYISVISYNQENFHSIVLRVAINSSQFQDVAVIEVSKNNRGRVVIQVIGDEALYGKNYILEPSIQHVSETPNPGYVGGATVFGDRIVYVDDWSIVAYLFSPTFSVYVSPWYWGFYPSYWHPWTPYRYSIYWNFHYHYYRAPYYRRAAFVRFPTHYSYYLKRRITSPVVRRYSSTGVYSRTYEGRTYRRPTSPAKLPRNEVRREIRRETKSQPQSSTRQQKQQTNTAQERRAVRQQTPSDSRQERRTTREQSPSTRRQQTQPNSRQERRDVRQQNQSSNQQSNRREKRTGR